MNGQTFQMCKMVISAREAMFTGCDFVYELEKYVFSIKYVFCNNYIAESVEEWFRYCRKHGLIDIQFMIPTKVENRYTLVFSNTGNSSIVCYWQDGRVTYFVAEWGVDSISKKWSVIYREQEWVNAPFGRPHFENLIEDYKETLLYLQHFAMRIKCNNFARCFGDAYEALCGNVSPDLLQAYSFVPMKYRSVFVAISKSDVFGGMGSWNDDPSGIASEMGLKEAYDKLSDKLLAHIRYNMMYVCNECFA